MTPTRKSIAPARSPAGAAQFVEGFQHALVVASAIAFAAAVLAVLTVRKVRPPEAALAEAGA